METDSERYDRERLESAARYERERLESSAQAEIDRMDERGRYGWRQQAEDVHLSRDSTWQACSGSAELESGVTVRVVILDADWRGLYPDDAEVDCTNPIAARAAYLAASGEPVEAEMIRGPDGTEHRRAAAVHLQRAADRYRDRPRAGS